MPRKIRYIIPQIPHHALQRGNNRQKIFSDKKDKDYFLANLKQYAQENKVAIGAYCLMTNHFHLLLYPESYEGLVNFMKLISQVYSQYINRKHKRTGKLWENRYKLHIVDPDYEWVVTRYIEQNPFRAGIVKKAEDYKYSSARAHLNGVDDDILTKDILKGEKKDYRIFFDDDKARDVMFLDKIRTILKQEKVLGSNDFIKRIEKRFKASFIVRERGRPAKNK
ncbi:MAG: transposase [Candidatus Omnitrophica bacterium]|nr:transposase [Candidatus Omnitrophota bacterium]